MPEMAGVVNVVGLDVMYAVFCLLYLLKILLRDSAIRSLRDAEVAKFCGRLRLVRFWALPSMTKCFEDAAETT
jgi:hypothetical protein